MHVTSAPPPRPASPLRLAPIYMERVWGGQTIADAFGRTIPPGARIGESWEVVDRQDEASVVVGGRLDGWSLHQLWTEARAPIFGASAPDTPRFPLLLKILDARDTLSIQVHPPAAVAAREGGEPKTEMWYIARADADAALYVGVKPGIGRPEFAAAIEAGTVADIVHRLPVGVGDFLFVPSGRLHAIGAGLLIFEIQQNSDTTYRVFDWNRLGLDGKPRALHVAQSLACIDFTDTAPSLGCADGDRLVTCEHFIVERRELAASSVWGREGEFSLATLVNGAASIGGVSMRPGDSLLVPACLTRAERHTTAAPGTVVLDTHFPLAHT